MSPSIAHGGMDPRSQEKPKKPKKELEEIRIREGEKGGHVVKHSFTSYEHPTEEYPFSDNKETVELPKGHVLQHIAVHVHIPHTVIEEKEQSANQANKRADEPDEEEELEDEA